ncbi:MAG: choice-of-anchor X domain-containing protein [Kangiellaceae bacterium]
MKTKTSKLVFVSTTLLYLCGNSLIANAATPKHIAVPPQDIASQQMAQPSQKGSFSHSTLLPISAKNLVTNKTILMDNDKSNPIVFLSPSAAEWQMQITNATGQLLLDESNQKLSTQSLTIGNQSFNGKQLEVKSPSVGEWQVNLTHTNPKQALSDNGFLMFKGDPIYKLYSHLDSNLTTQNSNLNIIAYMVNDSNKTLEARMMNSNLAMQSSISKAYVTITTPSKQKRLVALNDSGINGDKIAGDGLYSAKIPTHETGIYTSQVQVEGVRPDGVRYSRTVTDIYPVEKANYKFNPKSAELKYSNDRTVISVPVKSLGDRENIFLSAEVWGTNSKNERQSAAWIGGVVSPSGKSADTHLELSFDTRWLKRLQLKAPFALKSLRLQTVNSNVPIAKMDKLSLNLTSRILSELPFDTHLQVSDLNKDSLSQVFKDTDTEITQEMLMGTAPQQNRTLNKASGSKLLLVHGYCSGSVWNSNHFTDAAVFEDYDANRTHEEFAQLILDFGAPYSSYGIVAHSQGGAAALHLYSRYWSGLDNATGGRLIQSVGTPYQGTSLAGNIAAIGAIFGIQCGYATDLTYSGASNWLSTIPNWARSEVDYYTTSFTDKWWRWDYCHIASDFLLSDPEDGTTEKWSGKLSGAVNRGHTTGQCHTSGMRDPAQTNDANRNASMNSRAAR